jgi:hypothetical protein
MPLRYQPAEFPTDCLGLPRKTRNQPTLAKLEFFEQLPAADSPLYTRSRLYRCAISTARNHCASPSLRANPLPRRSVHRFDFRVWGEIANRQ